MYYMCPNHQAEYREDGDAVCNNYVSRNGIKMIKDEVGTLYELGELGVGYRDAVSLNKSSNTYKSKGKNVVNLDYEILDVNEDYVTVGVMNNGEGSRT